MVIIITSDFFYAYIDFFLTPFPYLDQIFLL